MIIKSDFKDYYDCIQRTGQNHEIVYIRKQSEQKTNNFRQARGFSCINIGFAGKMYFGIDTPNGYIYTSEQADKLTDSYIIELIYNSIRYRGFSNSVIETAVKESRKKLHEYFNKTPEAFFSCYFDYRCPIFVIREKFTEKYKYETFLTCNPQLNCYNFEKVRNPWEAFQDLQMWFGNQAVPEKPIPVPNDKIMAEIKGFDKYSFRKDKQFAKKR